MQSLWRLGATGVFMLALGLIMARAEAPGQSASLSAAKQPPAETASPDSAKESPASAVPEGTVGGELPGEKPVPTMQVLPLPYDQASFQYLGRELTRYHFGPGLQRPFLYPVAGPEGRSLTLAGPITVQPGQPLRLRYGLWIHPGAPTKSEIDAQWQQFAKSPLPALPSRKR